MCGANSWLPHVYGFSTARHSRRVPIPLISHSLGVTASLRLALSQSVTIHVNAYMNWTWLRGW